jgi:hypothetical protein
MQMAVRLKRKEGHAGILDLPLAICKRQGSGRGAIALIEAILIDTHSGKIKCMRNIHHPTRRLLTLVLILAFGVHTAIPARAQSPVKLQNWQGSIDYSPDDVSTFALEGTASHLGDFRAYGEIELVPGEEEDSFEGKGVVVFEAANGDLLVGVTTWDVGSDMLGGIHFSWRDAVTLADGTVVSSTGRFTHDRPPGLVVIAIIAILMGLLVPAVQ